MIKKQLFALTVVCALLGLCACGEKNTNVYVPDISVPDTQTQPQEEIATTDIQIPDESIPPQDIVIPTLPTTEQATKTEVQDSSVSAEHGYTNEYSASGNPLKLYTISPFGDYTGEYETYTYDYSNRLTSLSVYKMQADGNDTLVSQATYLYDGRGNLYSITEQRVGTDGNLYTEKTKVNTNDSSGKATTVTDTVFTENGDTVYTQQTKNTYNEYGLIQKEEIYTDSVLTSRTEYVYTFAGYNTESQTKTTVYNPDTDNEHTSVVTTVYDTDGNPVSVSEQDENGTFLTEYAYDENGREIENRAYDSQGKVLQYILTSYTDIGGGNVKVTAQNFAADGTLHETTETYYDTFGNVFIPG